MTDDIDAQEAVTASRLLELIAAFCIEINPCSPAPEVTRESQFESDLGLDSLARSELMSRIEKAFHQSLPVESFSSAATPADILRLLAATEDGSMNTPRTPAGFAPPADQLDPPTHAATLVDALRWHATRRPSQPHIVFADGSSNEETLSYEALYRSASRVAYGLRALGVAPGDTVALMLPTGRDYFACFAGILLAGAIAVPVYPPTHAARLADHLRRHVTILVNASVRTMIVPEGVEMAATLVRARAPLLQHVVAPRALTGPGMDESYEARAADVALLQYTSGSTGTPKGVLLTHANLLANIRAMGRTIEVGRHDVILSWLPLYHDMGLIGAWLAPLYFGVPLVLMSPLTFLARPERWLQAISQYRATITAAPNFAYARCTSRIAPDDLNGVDLSSLRLAVCGAEPVNPRTMRAFAERFASHGFDARALTPVYGLAENTLGLTFSPPGRGMRVDRVSRATLAATRRAVPATAGDDVLELVSCGAALPGNTLRIVDADGCDLPERVAGRIEFRSSSATSGYFRNAEQTGRTIHGGWIDTGDIGYLADGELYINGRAKDLVIRAGRHFFPYELEEAVSRLAGVRQGCVAVCGLPDEASGTDQLIVMAETRETSPEALARIRLAINDATLALLGAPPERIALVPPRSILKTSSGKIRHADTLSLYVRSAGKLRPQPHWRQWALLLADSLVPMCRRAGVRTLEVAYGGACWLLFASIGVPVWMATTSRGTETARNWRIASRACRLFLRLAGMRLSVRGIESGRMTQNAILVANHASYLDGLVLLAGLPAPVLIVAKRELTANPITRLFLKSIGVYFVERHDHLRGIAAEKELIARAATGEPLLFFAEGTFTRAVGVRPFRLGAFVTACATRRPAIPVAISGARAILPDGRWLPRRGAITVSLLEPIEACGEGIGAAVRMRDSVRAAISHACGERMLSMVSPARVQAG
ncbi:AMP-binding protein [Paraburkholderia edwinii]|uniref:AMP-binding protein n=1 Tax=Paraburkholderia edwinii TaxID=2861782 RepID=A0ABX8UXF7_9BURK|nr:AMP-binding protein [Paraburkholderia edwinii]QYD71560.1 AMP-binding protein [Paraburkholderia edwinii]